jgi:hypothetical protein
MYALCLITVNPGKIDNVISYLSKKHKPMKEVMTVTGRADVSILFNGSLNDINKGVNDLKRIKDIVSTETLIEVEVDLGW